MIGHMKRLDERWDEITVSLMSHIFIALIIGRKSPHGCFKKSYKNVSRLKHYTCNFRTVNAIDFYFQYFILYVELYFGVLYRLRVDVTIYPTTHEVRKPPQLQVGAFKSLQIRCIRLSRLIGSVPLMPALSH